jgi:6-phosphogluconate dehydrogenase
MQIGMMGLGRMGANMVRRLMRAGHECVVYDINADAVAALVKDGAVGASSMEDFVSKLSKPRAAWLMLPAAITPRIADRVAALMEKGDTIIDGGNSNYKNTQRRHDEVKAKGFNFVDCGTSGGVWGLKEGYSLMMGGDKEPVERLTPIFQALAPSANEGWGHVGPAGAGHFVKMVHNGIEYGMMQAFAEGFSIMQAKEPLHLDLTQIAHIWQKGSVVRSWLLDLTAGALDKNPTLDGLEAWVPDSGEGRWTVTEAIDLNISAPVITESLIRRLRSREENNFTDRMISIMRGAFGGHYVKKS